MVKKITGSVKKPSAPKKTSIGGNHSMIKTSSMNKNRRASYKRDRGQGKRQEKTWQNQNAVMMLEMIKAVQLDNVTIQIAHVIHVPVRRIMCATVVSNVGFFNQ